MIFLLTFDGLVAGTAERMASRAPRRLVNGSLLTGTVLILCAIGAYATGILGPSPTYVRTTVAERRSLTRTVEAFGRVQPRRWLTIRPPLSGQIVALPVTEGMRVSTGGLLARLQTDRYESRVAKARARVKQKTALVARRRADSVRAQRRVERQETLTEAGMSFESRRQNAQHALRTATARLAAARAQVAEAQAQLERTREQGEHLRVRAPESGVVSQIRVQPGEHVVGTGLVPGTPMLRIDQQDRMEFRVRVGESVVPMISIGDSATIRLEAHPGTTYAARVAAVAGTRRSSSGGRRDGQRPIAARPFLFSLGAGFPVRLTLRCPDRGGEQLAAARNATPSDCPGLRTGMSGMAHIRATTIDSAVAVPRSAVTFRRSPDVVAGGSRSARTRPSTRPVVFTVHSGVAKRQSIETGLRTDALVAIRSGLRPGDEVVAGPADAVHRRLSDGDAVAGHDALPGGSSKE